MLSKRDFTVENNHIEKLLAQMRFTEAAAMATTLIKTQVESNEPNCQTYLLRAEARLKLNDLNDAREDAYSALFNCIGTDSTLSAKAYEMLGSIAEAAKEYEHARRLAMTALKQNPANATTAQTTLMTLDIMSLEISTKPTTDQHSPFFFHSTATKGTKRALEDEDLQTPNPKKVRLIKSRKD